MTRVGLMEAWYFYDPIFLTISDGRAVGAARISHARRLGDVIELTLNPTGACGRGDLGSPKIAEAGGAGCASVAILWIGSRL